MEERGRERDAGSMKMVEVSPSLLGLEQSRSYNNMPLRRPLIQALSDNMTNSLTYVVCQSLNFFNDTFPDLKQCHIFRHVL